jgi:uncharacterized Fe-S radical SAM superfamily protein PflX
MQKKLGPELKKTQKNQEKELNNNLMAGKERASAARGWKEINHVGVGPTTSGPRAVESIMSTLVCGRP